MTNMLRVEKKRFKRSLKGSIIAEAAISIPILLAITFFITEFGTVLYLSNTLNQIARSAARYASVTSSYTTSDLVNASGATSLLPDISKLTLSVNPAPGTAGPIGAAITVDVQYNYTPIINPFGLLNSMQSWAPSITSSAVIRSEVSHA